MCYKTYLPYGLEWNRDTRQFGECDSLPTQFARLLSQAHMLKINRDHRALLENIFAY